MNARRPPVVPPGQMSPPLPTGMAECHDPAGQAVPCPGSGQDGDGRAREEKRRARFVITPGGTVRDRLTGLHWHPSADAMGYPVSFSEALSAVTGFNAAAAHGRRDWRMPNRRELRSILCHGAKNPALWPGHPFRNVFSGRYWTSTSFAGSPAHAWYVHLEGARVFFERKDRYCLLWPVCGDSHGLAATGQTACFDAAGEVVPCAGSGQDGETRRGLAWPNPRFVSGDWGEGADVVFDRLTGLSWLTRPFGAVEAQEPPAPCDWGRALAAVAAFAARDGRPWRLPDINELESLTDLSRAFPALPGGHPFRNLGDGFWSATTSFYDPAWAYVLYLGKGAVGVGFKVNREFLAWPVLRPKA